MAVEGQVARGKLIGHHEEDVGFCLSSHYLAPMKSVLIALIRFYQLTLSSIMGRQCRFLPTCSDYAKEAIDRYGVIKGGRLAVKRVCRCHPWGGEGFDPVPEKLE
jgi:hypothetical protein